MTRLCAMAALTFEEFISKFYHLFAPICEAHPAEHQRMSKCQITFSFPLN